MKKFLLLLTLLGAMTGIARLAFGVTISLDPSPHKIHPPANVFVDINISGLQSGNVNTLLGGFSLDFLYDPNVLTFLPVPPAGWGNALGNVSQGEAVGNIDFPAPGVIHISEVSLLEADPVTCVFCIPPYLVDLQQDSFTLLTLGFYAPGTSSSGPVTYIGTDNVILSDPAGNHVTDISGNPVSIVTPVASIFIPEPPMIILVGIGLMGLLLHQNRKVTGG